LARTLSFFYQGQTLGKCLVVVRGNVNLLFVFAFVPILGIHLHVKRQKCLRHSMLLHFCVGISVPVWVMFSCLFISLLFDLVLSEGMLFRRKKWSKTIYANINLLILVYNLWVLWYPRTLVPWNIFMFEVVFFCV